MNKLSLQEITELLRYDGENGQFYWLSNRGGKAYAGSKAGTVNADGYVQIVIGRNFFYGHRLAWAFTHGAFPDVEIDHRNGVTSDNRIDNLRIASSGQNKMNVKIRKDNSSGVKGVGWVAHRKKWSARLQVNGAYVLRKTFSTLEDAKEAIERARNEHHGEFANHGNN